MGALLLLLTGMLASWGACAVVVVFLSPEAATKLLFFGGLAAGVVFTMAMLAFILSFYVFPLKRDQGNLGRAIAQGVPVGVVLALAAWLQSLRVLSYAVAAVLAIIVVLVEFLLLPSKAKEV